VNVSRPLENVLSFGHDNVNRPKIALALMWNCGIAIRVLLVFIKMLLIMKGFIKNTAKINDLKSHSAILQKYCYFPNIKLTTDKPDILESNNLISSFIRLISPL
jgi:hypothetical protein